LSRILTKPAMLTAFTLALTICYLTPRLHAQRWRRRIARLKSRRLAGPGSQSGQNNSLLAFWAGQAAFSGKIFAQTLLEPSRARQIRLGAGLASRPLELFLCLACRFETAQ
jgi:hypothetical protein